MPYEFVDHVQGLQLIRAEFSTDGPNPRKEERQIGEISRLRR